jgi:anthranilate/para-aminobenzoate synthase component I
MRLSPSFDEFAKALGGGKPQVVWTKLVADLETPVSAFLKISGGEPMSFLFESVEGGETRGRYSVIGLRPDLVWRARRGKAEINRTALVDANAFRPDPAKPLDSLRALVAASRIEMPQGLPPMASGLFGYMGYDMVREIERLPDNNPDQLGVPDSIFIRPTVIAIFDNIEDSIAVAPRRARRSPRQCRRRTRRARPITQWSRRRRSTSSPATSSRWCRHSASPCRSRCRRSRSTVRCAGSIRRRICSSSISAASRSSARARKSWCACATAS